MSIKQQDDAQAKPKFTLAGFRRGAIASIPVAISTGAAGIVMGLSYKGMGFGLAPALLFSLVVFSATAQAVTFGLWMLPPPVGAMMAACVATNARYLVMGASLRQLFGGLPKLVMLPMLFFLSDVPWMMTLTDAGLTGPDAGYFLGANLPVAIGWVSGTGLGYALPLHPGGTLAVAASLLPLAFIATLLPLQWRGMRSFLPWVISGVIGIASVKFIGTGWAMLLGGSIGTGFSMMRGDDA